MESGASLYIGDWVRGVRQGYGVQEDIMGGEKYMGDWECGVRQGKGCVVTSDGIYYQGNRSIDEVVNGTHQSVTKVHSWEGSLQVQDSW